MNSQITFPLTGVAASELVFGTPLGTVVYGQGGRMYKAVKAVDAVTYLRGQSVTYANAARTHVTNDRSGGTSLSLLPAGIIIATPVVPTVGTFCWIQTWGDCDHILMNADDDAAVGDQLIIHPTSDGLADTIAYATTARDSRTFGSVTTAVVAATNIVTGYLFCP